MGIISADTGKVCVWQTVDVINTGKYFLGLWEEQVQRINLSCFSELLGTAGGINTSEYFLELWEEQL